MRFTSIRPDLPKRSLRFELGAAILLAFLCLRGADLARHSDHHSQAFDVWRQRLVVRIGDIFDPPASHWVAGVLLGADEGFSRRWIDAFRRTGTSHLTAVSGYNVGVVLVGVQAALLRLPVGRAARACLALAAVAGFVLLTGSPGSVLRAAVMVAAGEAARHFGRPVRPLRALLLAAVLIGLVSPRSLVADRGFQLSAAASFGLATLAPPLAATLFRRLPSALAEWGSQTLAATLATAPLIAWMTGTYSLVALPANIAVAAFIPPIMAGGAAIVAVSLVSLPLARLLAGIGEGLFTLPLALIRTMASWPIASVSGAAAFAALIIAEIAALALVLRWRRIASFRYGL
ncbi:MAG TPA: ComEC/Rec2 family competence protein, partial [Candidatus Baltobacteraceae bacterium]|nr:ComEC/Rec2 family competence protein [Candidatus Baltobacteraceae bacterium]